MSTKHLTEVTIGTDAWGSSVIIMDVYTPYAAGLLEWYATGKERTHNVRGVIPGERSENEDRVIDLMVARDHVVYIATSESKRG